MTALVGWIPAVVVGVLVALHLGPLDANLGFLAGLGLVATGAGFRWPKLLWISAVVLGLLGTQGAWTGFDRIGWWLIAGFGLVQALGSREPRHERVVGVLFVGVLAAPLMVLQFRSPPEALALLGMTLSWLAGFSVWLGAAPWARGGPRLGLAWVSLAVTLMVVTEREQQRPGWRHVIASLPDAHPSSWFADPANFPGEALSRLGAAGFGDASASLVTWMATNNGPSTSWHHWCRAARAERRGLPESWARWSAAGFSICRYRFREAEDAAIGFAGFNRTFEEDPDKSEHPWMAGLWSRLEADAWWRAGYVKRALDAAGAAYLAGDPYAAEQASMALHARGITDPNIWATLPDVLPISFWRPDHAPRRYGARNYFGELIALNGIEGPLERGFRVSDLPGHFVRVPPTGQPAYWSAITRYVRGFAIELPPFPIGARPEALVVEGRNRRGFKVTLGCGSGTKAEYDCHAPESVSPTFCTGHFDEVALAFPAAERDADSCWAQLRGDYDVRGLRIGWGKTDVVRGEP